MAEVVPNVQLPAEAGQDLIPGGVVVARTRRMLIAVLVAGVAYSFMTHASKGVCAGGVTGGGGLVDSSGDAADAASSCLMLTLGPSPLMLVAFAVITIVTLCRVVNTAHTENDADRIIDRSAVIVVALAAVSVVVSQIWFGLIPVSDWSPTGSYSFFYPFPFGSVDLSVTPMPAA